MIEKYKYGELCSSIKVAVRLRPFNVREKKKGCKLIVDMHDDGTVVLDMRTYSKGYLKFNFDYAFWSFDNSQAMVNQDTLWENLGFVVPEAFDGYNSSIFAYGQTGAGKSYSMMGPVDDPGIVYKAVKDFFIKREEVSEGVKIELDLSFLEIYNEEVHDLLNKSIDAKQLKVMVDSKRGVYVQGLSIRAVASFEQAKNLIDIGFNNRSVASTNMNATSSRSHCIFTMYIRKLFPNDGGNAKVQTEAKVNLIDLAGSERQGKIGAVGARLNKATSINKSLSALGNVISALAKNEKFIPYRSSVLTLLLRESLGGNSKATMLCAISPAVENGKETWSTLRYASRVKEIRNKIKRSDFEDPSVLIAQLEKTLKDLQAQLKSNIAAGKESPISKAVIRDEVTYVKAEIVRREKSHEQRSQELQREVEEQDNEFKSFGLAGLINLEADENTPRLINISPDPIMSGRFTYFLVQLDQDIMIGSKKREDANDNRIALVCENTSNVQEEHATINLSGEAVIITLHNPMFDLYVNGKRVEKKVNIYHGDRIVFGTGQVCFQFLSPKHLSPKPVRSLEVFYNDVRQELEDNDEEVIKHRDQLKADRSKSDTKSMVLISLRKSLEEELRIRILEESKIRMTMEVEESTLKEEVQKAKTTQANRSNDTDLKTKEKKIAELATKLQDKTKRRKALERALVRKTKLYYICEQFDKEVEEQLSRAVTLCRLSNAMAKLNKIDSRYSTVAIPFWDDKVGVPNEKVMIIETFHVDGTFIDNMYDYHSFVERHNAHAEYESRDKTKMSVNPFVPDMPTQNVGHARITETGRSMEPYEFSIEATDGGGVSGKIKAWLTVDADGEECDISFTVGDIILDNYHDQNLSKLLTFVSLDGKVQMIEFGLADNCESFYFPTYKILAQGSKHLERYMKKQGIMVFVSVYTYKSNKGMPTKVFGNFMDCQIELKRCKVFLEQQEKKLTLFQKELAESQTIRERARKEHKRIVENLEAKNVELHEISKSSSSCCNTRPMKMKTTASVAPKDY